MAEKNLIKNSDLAKAREVDFVYKFNDGIQKLVEALGITRKIPMQAGTNLKAYKATGTLQDGYVPEGDIIPLSHYKTEPITFAEITIQKWRKATSAEAIVKKGFSQAVNMTTAEMLRDVQKGIKKNFFGFLDQGTGLAAGSTFQATLANIWGQLQVLFEDTEIQAVYFMNPIDVSDYLGSAPITVQQAFGMSYIENFLGLGTVILNSNVPKGKVYGTAKDNIVLYYVPVNGADLDNAFAFTSDQLGYIGIHEVPDYDNLTCKDTVMCGIVLFAERIDGVVIGEIGGTIIPTIDMDTTAFTIPVGGVATIKAKVAPAGSAYEWTSATPAVATVTNGLSNADGVVKGLTEGSSVITLTVGSVSKNVTVTVEADA
jgi:hypothetical protein